MTGTAPEDVVAHGLDAVEDARSPEPGEAHLEAQVAADAVAQGPAFREERAGSGHELGHERLPLVRDPARVQVPLAHVEARAQLTRNVDPVLAKVDGHVLPMVRKLEPRADRVGQGRQGRIGVAEHQKHEAAHGVGRAAAIVEELVPGVVAALYGVLAEGRKQIEEQLLGDAQAADGLAEGHEDRVLRVARVRRMEACFPLVELLAPHPLVHRLVGEIVGRTGERVEGVDVPPLVLGDE